MPIMKPVRTTAPGLTGLGGQVTSAWPTSEPGEQRHDRRASLPGRRLQIARRAARRIRALKRRCSRAMQAGMLQALYERGIVPDLLVGTSAGELNAAFAASRPQTTAAARELTAVWRGRRRRDIFPRRPAPQQAGTGILAHSRYTPGPPGTSAASRRRRNQQCGSSNQVTIRPPRRRQPHRAARPATS